MLFDILAFYPLTTSPITSQSAESPSPSLSLSIPISIDVLLNYCINSSEFVDLLHQIPNFRYIRLFVELGSRPMAVLRPLLHSMVLEQNQISVNDRQIFFNTH